jgi:DNA-binding MarR family transcriptional regulator
VTEPFAPEPGDVVALGGGARPVEPELPEPVEVIYPSGPEVVPAVGVAPVVPAGPAVPPIPVDGAALGAELSTAVILFHEAIGHRLGLSAADQRALGIIGGRGPMTAGTLAQLTGLSPAAVTGLIDRLEHGGHVTRSAHPDDRRSIVITAVSTPRAGIGEAFARLGAEMNALVSRYDARESAAILDYLQRTIAILREQTRRLSD